MSAKSGRSLSVIPFQDLRPVSDLLEKPLEKAFHRVLRSGHYVLGPELEAFETELAEYLGLEYVIGVASGTDAITLALMANGFGPGSKILTVANSAPATVAAIKRTGAEVDFVDAGLDGHFTIDYRTLSQLRSYSCFVPVHLYGRTADLTRKNVLMECPKIVEDACQAIKRGSDLIYPIGSRSSAACFSFYPTKNLGCIGDGGAIGTKSSEVNRRVRSLRFYGQEGPLQTSYGLNSRLDELQAALLRVKLKHLDFFRTKKMAIDRCYRNRLNGIKAIRIPPEDFDSNGHLFPIFVPPEDRNDLKARLRTSYGIETKVHYPVAAHMQPCEPRTLHLPVTERLCASELSLPNWVGMTDRHIDRVCNALRRIYA